jgi:hypothetical protein
MEACRDVEEKRFLKSCCGVLNRSPSGIAMNHLEATRQREERNVSLRGRKCRQGGKVQNE